MNGLSARPFRLASNRVNYLLPGGEMIDEFLGLARGAVPGASQMWVASTVQSTLPGAADSRSYILPEDGGGCLAEELQKDPAAFLGSAHAAAFGADVGFLLKLLHSSQRLLVQAHPDKAKAEKYFRWPHGKTEAWYVLATEGEAYIWAGFRPGVTREGFAALIEQQDTAAILGCLHQFAIAPGDVVFIPAGLPHAMGANSLVAEIQEPTDITLRAEYIRPDGSRLPPESLHGGAGMEALLDCFDFSAAAPRGGAGEILPCPGPAAHPRRGGDHPHRPRGHRLLRPCAGAGPWPLPPEKPLLPGAAGGKRRGRTFRRRRDAAPQTGHRGVRARRRGGLHPHPQGGRAGGAGVHPARALTNNAKLRRPLPRRSQNTAGPPPAR